METNEKMESSINNKIKTNINTSSAASMPSKVPSQINFENRVSNLMIIEEGSSGHESQVQTPTNYHQGI